ncbi:MAG: sugar phosphate isomerase/epimerase [Kiritimatiellaeota bacterium]|nr:sugar phosphate isomerase/epimerase [Kiritimatiellota bacterium]
MGSLKIGVALWSFGQTPDMAALDKNLKTAAEVGVKGVQPWVAGGVLDPDNLVGRQARNDVRKRIGDMGLTITALCAHMPPFNVTDGLEGRVTRTKKALELSVDFEAPIITGHVGEIPEDHDDPRWGILVQSMSEIARHGAAVGACLALETGAESPEALRDLLETVDSPGLRVNFDPANIRRFGVLHSVRVLRDYIVHTHAKDGGKGSVTVGSGEVPWDEYIALLKETGYDGWYAIEDESGKGVIDSVRRGVAFLERY